jgi:hypothetical protein
MEIGLSAPMTTLMLLKLLGRSWFRLDPAPPLLPSVGIIGCWIPG